MIAGLVCVIDDASNNIHTQLYVLKEFANNRDPRTGDCPSFQFHYMTMNYNKSHSTYIIKASLCTLYNYIYINTSAIILKLTGCPNLYSLTLECVK